MLVIWFSFNIGRAFRPVRCENGARVGEFKDSPGSQQRKNHVPRPLEERPSRPEVRSLCAGCGRPFDCGAKSGAPACWCAELAQRLPVPAEPAGCYCRACLEKLIASRPA
jgi:hypothetical protein